MKTLAIVLMLLAGAACGQNTAPAQPSKAAPASPPKEVRFVAEDVVTNVEVPWAIVFDPSGRMIFTERPGRVRVYENGKLRAEPYYTVPNVLVAQETGLMGLCLHPQYEKNKHVYLAFGFRDGGAKDVRVVRYRDTGSTLEEDKVIVSGIAVKGNHSGCFIKFGPDGKLYISTGEMFDGDLAQDMGSINGKILRVNDDGTAPQDNPFVGKEGARPEIWALGVRNPQSFDWQPGTGKLFETEHGPSREVQYRGTRATGGDEFNHIEKGKNYGWPVIFYNEKKAGMETPLIVWSSPTMAPGGGCFYSGDAFPQLEGNYLVGCLFGREVRRIVLDGTRVVSDTTLLRDYGRVRAVTQGPDGFVYFSTSNKDGRGEPARADDRVVRLKPAS
jgi:glucose/arabinose dehydrogenase